MSSKHLIIIPGSCSRRSNWFDQINFFEKEGYKVSFIDIEAHRFKNLIECADNIFANLRILLNEQPAVIMSHSMGGMLLLKILSENKLYSNDCSKTFNNLQDSKIFFIQVPLSVHHPVLNFFNTFKYIFYPIQFVYRWVFAWLVEEMLLGLKFLAHALPFGKTFVSFALNKLLMVNAFFSTDPKEFSHLINYYRQWDEFSLRGFFQGANLNRFEKAMINVGDDKSSGIDFISAQEYLFTIGAPDVFCNDKLTREFAEKIGANILELQYGFHNPQHMFWTQSVLHQEVLGTKNVTK